MDLISRCRLVENDMDSISRSIDKFKDLKKEYQKNIDIAEKEIEFYEALIFKFRLVKKTFQKITDDRNKVKQSVASLIDRSLEKFLGHREYYCTIEDGDRGDNGKKTEIILKCVKTDRPRKAGRAVRQLVSLISILSCIEISGSSKYLFLDEYLNGASGKSARKLSDLLVSLAKAHDFQFFIVNQEEKISENPEFERIFLKKVNGNLKVVTEEEFRMEEVS